MPTAPLRPAAFLDRDGTIMRDMHYPRDPELVVLVDDAATAMRRLAEADIPVVVITNQSGIAQGKVQPAEYEAVRDRLDELLAAEGVRVVGHYFCPHHPDFTGPCACRKPGTLLYETAGRDHGLDVRRSLFAGDRWRDVQPALTLGGFGVLVPSEATPAADRERAEREAIVLPTLTEAVSRFLGRSQAP
jgi:D-glycero-D-manno-heptose 1,7-bisphosphate phosphatase